MILSFAFLAAGIMQAAAPDWRALDVNGERRWEWNANGVTRNGEITTILLRRFPIPARQGANAWSISRLEIRCAAGTLRVVETVNYSSDGIEGERDLQQTEFQAIPTTSIIAPVRDQLCGPAAAAH